MKAVLIMVFCLLMVALQAQELDMEQFIADVFEQYSAESGENVDFENFMEELMVLSKSTIDLNQTNRDELQQLLFLSALQIENLLYHLYRHGPMHSVYELQLVDGFDLTDIRRMLPFITLSQQQQEQEAVYTYDLLHYARHELLMRVDRVLEPKSGYRSLSGNEPAYAGDPFYYHLKYRYRYRDRIQMKFALEKDAGEPVVGGLNKGYDFASGSLQYSERNFKLVVGDYQVGFGQGLVIRQAFRTGKSSYNTHLMSAGTGFRPYGSTGEYNFLRGMAVTVEGKSFRTDAFYSNRLLDGTTEEGQLISISTDGLHRTVNEIMKRQQVREQLTGLHLAYRATHYELGVNAVYNRLDRELLPPGEPYRFYVFRGKQQAVAGIDYKLRLYPFLFFGETAMTFEGAPATLNTLSASVISGLRLSVSQRYYAPGYNALHASAFSESTRVGNESGFYLGVETDLIPGCRLHAYADAYRFPWLRYGTDSPAQGKELMLQLSYRPRPELELQGRFKYEDDIKNESMAGEPMSQLTLTSKASLRFQLQWEWGSFRFRNQLEANQFEREGARPSYGLLALQDLSYKAHTLPLSVDLRFLFFDTASYDNRIYAYERDVLYGFSVPAFNGRGSRFYLNLRVDPLPQLSCYFKLSQTIYADDRESIGTGNESIQGTHRTDLRLLLRWKFQ